MYKLDYKRLRALSIEDVGKWLNLSLKKEAQTLRCQCPQNEGEARELVLTPAKNTFHCYGCETSGSCIDLVAHVQDTGLREAAQALEAHYFQKAPQKAPEAPQEGFDPQKVLGRINYEHEALQPFLEPDVARQLGIGVDVRGYLRGYIAIPLRLPDGTISGFVGVPIGTALKFPKQLKIE